MSGCFVPGIFVKTQLDTAGSSPLIFVHDMLSPYLARPRSFLFIEHA